MNIKKEIKRLREENQELRRKLEEFENHMKVCPLRNQENLPNFVKIDNKKRRKKTGQKNGHKKKTRRFMKLSIAVDTENQFVLTHKLRKSRTHDSKDFKFLCKKLNCNHVVADKGYDSKDLRKFVVYELGAKPHIPYRNCSGKVKRGRFISPLPDKRIYPKRQIVENVFFCIKRKYGSVLRNRTVATQKVELISKLVAHNVDRMQHYLLLIRGCTSARFLMIKHHLFIQHNPLF